MATLATGTMLGERYEIVRAIKAGGMGAVYEARDRRLADSRCAIKQLLDHDADDESVVVLRRKFDEEMQFLASLSHPGIPRLRDFFSDGSRQFLVMDLVEGTSLDEELEAAVKEGRTIPQEQVVNDAIELLDILVYLHGRKPPVVHRDIKPANIIRENDGRLKLLDFGIARLHEGRTTTHTQLGTLCYAPLEQIQGHAEPRSDLYGLAATMHHLISGVESPALAVPPLQRVAPHVDPDLAAIVNRAVATAPIDRYDDAVAMRAALIEWRNGHLSGAATAQLPYDAPGTLPLTRGASHTALRTARETVPMPSEPQPSRAPIALAIAAVVAVAAMLLWLMSPRTPAPAAPPSPAPVVGSRVETGAPLAVTAATPPPAVPAATPTDAGPRIGYATAKPAAPKASATAARPTAPRTTAVPVAAVPRSTPAPVAAAPAATPPPAAPPPVAASTPLPASYTVAPPIAPAPPTQQQGPPRGGPGGGPGPDGAGPPGGGPPGGGPPGGGDRPPNIADFQVSLPANWQAAVTGQTEQPPRKDFAITSPSTQGHINFTVWIMPRTVITQATSVLLTQLQHEQWRIGAPVTSGGVQVFSLERNGSVGALEMRAETIVGEHVRLYAATLTATSPSDLSALRRVTDEYLLR